MTSPSEAQSLREAVARVIDPWAFRYGDPDYYGPDLEKATYSARQRVALKTADAVLTGPIGAHIAKIEAERDAAEANAFTLAANQCEGPMVGDDHGNFRCAQVATLTARLAEVEAERDAAHAKGRAEGIGEAVKVCEAAEGRSCKADYPYDSGAGSSGYEMACGDIFLALRALLPTTGGSND